MSPVVNDFAAAIALIALVLISLELGFRLGRRAAADSDRSAPGQIGSIQGALLGLLGLLLAFSFSAAGSRFLERQDLIVREANAIGTAFLRADLLDEPHRNELRTSLQRYTEHRLRLSEAGAAPLSPQAVIEIERFHAEIWAAARQGVAARPQLILAVLDPVNEVIDVHSLRLAAMNKHLPGLVLGLLISASSLAIGAIGYGCGLGGRRRAPFTVTLAMLIGSSLWITIDLDHSREGLLRLSDAPLQALNFDSTNQ